MPFAESSSGGMVFDGLAAMQTVRRLVPVSLIDLITLPAPSRSP